MKHLGLATDAIDHARYLRRNATDAERILWRALRESLPHAKFRRQMPLGPYFADFASFSARLIVEVDGGQHANTLEYDGARTRFFEKQGYRVLRFWNNEVLGNTDGILSAIAAALSPSPSQASPGSLPLPSGEGITE